MLTNPTLIIEVLSPSTENYDRGTKFHLYKTIPTFQDYLLIDSRQKYVQHFHKLDSKTWQDKAYESLDEEIYLEQFGINIALKDIYSGIEFETDADSSV